MRHLFVVIAKGDENIKYNGFDSDLTDKSKLQQYIVTFLQSILTNHSQTIHTWMLQSVILAHGYSDTSKCIADDNWMAQVAGFKTELTNIG